MDSNNRAYGTMLIRHDTGMKYFILEYADDWEKMVIMTHIANLEQEMRVLNEE